MPKKLYVLLFITTFLQSDTFYNTMSMQGMTGVINTPTAEVISDGDVEFQFSNQVDFVRAKQTRNLFDADQYFLNIGLLPNLEVIGRLANIMYKEEGKGSYDGYLIRDLSASFKYQIPFYHEYLPKVAVGIQDLGGQASHYDSKYIVATKEYGFLRGSVGYGFDSINLLNGAFASLEVKATDWATLLAEYDSKEKQVGLRLNTPKGLLKYADVAFLAKANVDDGNQRFSFGLNVRIPIGDSHHDSAEVQVAERTDSASAYYTTPHASTAYHDDNASVTLPLDGDYKTEALKVKLVEIGLENIDISEGGERIYLAYENNIFEHNELDALGAVLGAMVALDVPYQKFDIVIKRSNQKVKQVSGDLVAYKAFVRDYSPVTLRAFRSSLVVQAPKGSIAQGLKVENANSSYLKTRLRLYPGLLTFVGTEYGTFDYLLSLRTALQWNLYKGFDLTMLADFPLVGSDDLDEDTGRFKKYRRDSEIINVGLHRSDTFGSFVNIASIGKERKFWFAYENLTYHQGNHTLGAKYAYYQSDDYMYWPGEYGAQIVKRHLLIGDYSYYYDKYDTLLELSAGQYFNKDQGFEVKVKRFFGDTSIGFFYQNANENYIGIQLQAPLTPRKVSDSYFQIKGRKNYTYDLRTTVQDEDGRNTLEPDGLYRAIREFDIEPHFLNRKRLSEDYIKKHVLRLRDAYEKYVVSP